MNNQLKKLSLIMLMCISLAACYDDSSTVTASTPESAYVVALGVHITVPVTFNANNGTVSNLHITSSLPDGWSMPNGQSAFNCATVSSTGKDCQLILTFAPTTVTNNTSFNLTYSYTDSNNDINYSGSLLIPYTAVPTSVFIPDQGNNNVRQCTVNPADGMISSYGCSTAIQNANLAGPTDIALQNFGNNNSYIYILNPFDSANPAVSNTVVSCPISSNGSIGACSSPLTVNPTGGSGTEVTSIAFQNVNANLYAYIINYGGDVIKCSANQGGTLSDCAFEPAGTPSSSEGITFQKAADTGTIYAYITDSRNTSITECTVDSSGDLESGSCNPVSLDQNTLLNTPYATTFQTSSNGTIYAYIANAPYATNPTPAAGYITQCTVPSVGSTNFSNCANTGGINGNNFGLSTLVSLANINDTTYAYVLNYRIGLQHYPGGIAKCAVNTNGGLSECTYMLQNINDPLAFHPTGITFFTAGA